MLFDVQWIQEENARGKSTRVWWTTNPVIESGSQIKQIFVWSEINNKRVGNANVTHYDAHAGSKTYSHVHTLFQLKTHWSTAHLEFAYDVILMNFRSLKYFRHYGRFIYSFHKWHMNSVYLPNRVFIPCSTLWLYLCSCVWPTPSVPVYGKHV